MLFFLSLPDDVFFPTFFQVPEIQMQHTAKHTGLLRVFQDSHKIFFFFSWCLPIIIHVVKIGKMSERDVGMKSQPFSNSVCFIILPVGKSI